MKRVLRNAGDADEIFDETVDEIVVTDCTFHLEQMDSNVYWIGITDKAGNSIAINLRAARDVADDPYISCTVEPDGPGWTWEEDRTHEA